MNSGDFSIGSDVWPGLAKLLEEAGEVIQVCGKIIAIRGNSDHWDGSDLRERLQEEIGDLIAAIAFVGGMNDLDQDMMERRAEDKFELFRKWQKEHSK